MKGIFFFIDDFQVQASVFYRRRKDDCYNRSKGVDLHYPLKKGKRTRLLCGKTIARQLRKEKASMWRMMGCCEQGRSHKERGLPCQDKYDLKTENGFWAVALADGAGSAALSHVGAQTVTTLTCGWLCDHFDRIFESENNTVREEFLDVAIAELDRQAEIDSGFYYVDGWRPGQPVQQEHTKTCGCC